MGPAAGPAPHPPQAPRAPTPPRAPPLPPSPRAGLGAPGSPLAGAGYFPGCGGTADGSRSPASPRPAGS